MPASVNLGYPIWLDGESFSGLIGRTFDVAALTFNNGSSSIVAPWGGVLPSAAAMFVQAGSGMQVTVNPGYCIVPSATSALNGAYRFGLLSQATLTLATSDATNPRIDLIIAHVQDNGDNTSYCEVAVLTGTAASSPSPPSTTGMHVIVLAQILVPATSTTVSSGNITDVRQFTCSPGGQLIIVNSTQLAALTNPYVGMKIFRRDLNVEQVFYSGQWWTVPQTIVDSGWITLPYGSGWTANGGSPAYRKVQVGPQPIVRLRGTVARTSGLSITLTTGVQVATLPTGFRPAFDIFVSVATQYTTDATARCSVSASTGAVIAQGNQTVAWVSLDGISFEQAN